MPIIEHSVSSLTSSGLTPQRRQNDQEMATQHGHEEASRLAVVRRYEILDTPPDGSFDHLAAVAAHVMNTPIAIISIVDADRIWFKSHYGLEIEETDRSLGFCASGVLQRDAWIINNAKTDIRSLTNPLVAGEFGFRFYAGVPLRSAEGQNIGMLCVLDRAPREVTPQQIANLEALAFVVMDQMELRLAARHAISEITEMMRTDALTGVANRRHFDERLAAAVQESREEGTQICIAVADVDHFKKINDEFGHATGDIVLRAMGRLLKTHIRDGDFVARWGGEEFTLLIQGDIKKALPVLERIRVTVGMLQVPELGRPFTISIGVAAVRPDESAAAVLKRADDALYVAKQEGRNRVLVSTP